MNKKMALRSERGFTIIELMIATAVLSTILVMVTVVMVNIGSLYYKGFNQAKVQDSVRGIVDETSRFIQLNDQSPTPPVGGVHNAKAVCIGSVRYTYVLGVQVGHPAPGTGTVYPHVLWRDKNPTPGSCYIASTLPDGTPNPNKVDLTQTTPSGDPNGAELIANNSRLTEFSMTTVSPTTVTVGEAYGDNDLLCNPAADPGSCKTPAEMTNWSFYTGNVLCKGLKGHQFCSTAHLTTSVVKRLGGDSF